MNKFLTLLCAVLLPICGFAEVYVEGRPTSLDGKYDKTGGSINGNMTVGTPAQDATLVVYGSTTAKVYYGNGAGLTNLPTDIALLPGSNMEFTVASTNVTIATKTSTIYSTNFFLLGGSGAVYLSETCRICLDPSSNAAIQFFVGAVWTNGLTVPAPAAP